MNEAKLITTARKSAVLTRPSFGCLKQMPAINVTRGCLHYCVYCYARGFRGAPGAKGEIYLYSDLPGRLQDELVRRRRVPAWVSFSTASDAFQNQSEILDVTFSCMKILLSHHIGVSFLTKGSIPDEFIKLFSRYPRLVRARIGLASVDDNYTALFEPNAALPSERLHSARRLVEIGIETALRVDPIIHRVTDSEEALNRLMKATSSAGITSASMSSLYLRPSFLNNIRRELPAATAEEVLKWYRGTPYQEVVTSKFTQLLPAGIRLRQYDSAKKIAARYGIECSIYGCKNPDLPFEPCDPFKRGGNARSDSDCPPKRRAPLPGPVRNSNQPIGRKRSWPSLSKNRRLGPLSPSTGRTGRPSPLSFQTLQAVSPRSGALISLTRQFILIIHLGRQDDSGDSF